MVEVGEHVGLLLLLALVPCSQVEVHWQFSEVWVENLALVELAELLQKDE